MDNFLAELLNPGAIVRTLILAVVGFYLVRRVDRWWSYRSAKSIQRRIKDVEARKFILDNLVKSDREILLFSFQSLFFIAFICSLIFIVKIAILGVKNGWNIYCFSDLLMLTLTSLMSWLAFDTLSKVQKYSESVEKIDKKTESLKARLSKLIDN